VAYVAHDKKGDFLVSGSRQSEHLPTIEDPEFSPSGNLLIAYCERDKSNIAFMVDFAVGDFYENDLGPDCVIPHFSPDGHSATYKLVKNGNAAPALNGKPVAWYDDVVRPTFNPVTGQLCYLAKTNGNWFLVQGADRTALTNAPQLLMFDGRHRVILYGVGGQTVVDEDGADSRRYDLASRFNFSPLGGALAYVGNRGGQDYIVFHQIEKGPFDNVWFLSISPEGNNLAYSAVRQGKPVVGIGTHEFPVDSNATALTPAPDAEHVAYMAVVGDKLKLFINERAVAEFSVNDPAPMDRFNMSFNSDGHLLAFPLIGKGKEWAAVADLDHNVIIKSPAYDYVRKISFSSDGKNVLFGALKGKTFLKVSMQIKK
jgi:hypothetical protein